MNNNHFKTNLFPELSEEELKKLNARDLNGQTLLHRAVARKDINEVKRLAIAGVDFDIQDNSGSTALHTCIHSGTLEIFKLLLDCNSNLSLQNNKGETPLLLAAILGKKDFIDAGMMQVFNSPVPPLPKGWTIEENEDEWIAYPPRQGVPMEPKITFFEVLYSAKGKASDSREVKEAINAIKSMNPAELRKKDPDGMSILRHAVRSGHVSIVHQLIVKANDRRFLNEMDAFSCSILNAAVLENEAILEELLKKGADANLGGGAKVKPLHFAICQEKLGMIKLLVKYGATYDLNDPQIEDLLTEAPTEIRNYFLDLEKDKLKQMEEKSKKDQELKIKEKEANEYLAQQKALREQADKKAAEESLKKKEAERLVLATFENDFNEVHEGLAKVLSQQKIKLKPKTYPAFDEIKNNPQDFSKTASNEIDILKIVKALLKISGIDVKDEKGQAILKDYLKGYETLLKEKASQEAQAQKLAQELAETRLNEERAREENDAKLKKENYELNLKLFKVENSQSSSSSSSSSLTTQYSKPKSRLNFFMEDKAAKEELKNLLEQLIQHAGQEITENLYDLKYAVIKFHGLMEKICQLKTRQGEREAFVGADQLINALADRKVLSPIKNGALHLLTLGASPEEQIAFYQNVLLSLARIAELNSPKFKGPGLLEKLEGTDSGFPIQFSPKMLSSEIYTHFKTHAIVWENDRAKNILKEANELIAERVAIVAHHGYPLSSDQVMIAAEIAELYQQTQGNVGPVSKEVTALIHAKNDFVHQNKSDSDIPAATLHDFLAWYQVEQRHEQRAKKTNKI